MMIGSLFYDPIQNRMDVRFGPTEYLGGLKAGTQFDVMENGVWMPTRLAKGIRWYLEGIHVSNINGLIVRLYANDIK